MYRRMAKMQIDELARHYSLLNDERNSLLYWYPRVSDIAETPRTVWVKVKDPLQLLEEVPPHVEEKLKEAVEELGGYPVFMRTDKFSGKHDYRYTCFVNSQKKLVANLRNLVELSLMHGLAVEAICLREYVELDWRFRAFDGLPIAPEVRVMVRDGKVERWFFYWPEDAIRRADRPNWPHLLREMKLLARNEAEEFLRAARKVAEKMEGYWSVDFARRRDGRWILVDMALGEVSWTPEVTGSASNSTDSLFDDILEEVGEIK